MSFLDEIKARRKRGPGIVEVIFADTEEVVEVPLRYPRAQEQSELSAFLATVKTDDDDAKMMDFTNHISMLVVKLCVKVDEGEELSDEDITVLVRESGGYQGALVQRCAQLLGMDNMLGNGGEERSRVVRKKTSKKSR